MLTEEVTATKGIENIKFIYTGIDCLNYPVGLYINSNKPRIVKLAEAFSQIEEFKGKPLNLICRGSSGAIVATVFALTLPNPCNIVHVKKDGENSHDSSLSINKGLGYKNVIVDDWIDSGTTLNTIYGCLMKYDVNIVIDCLCVTGEYRELEFRPNTVLCSVENRSLTKKLNQNPKP